MGAAFEEKQIRSLKIGNAGGPAQGRLPIPTMHRCGDISECLINFKRPRGDPGMAGGESLQALLRGRWVSRHGLQERDRSLFIIIELLLLSKRKSRGTLPQQDRQGSECS